MIGTSTNFQDFHPAILTNLNTIPPGSWYNDGQCPVFRRQGIFSGKKQNGTLIE
jgi:hypothetical protein